MKRVFVWIAMLLAVPVLLLALGTLVPRPLWPEEPTSQPAMHRIALLSNPIHTDIAIPLDDVTRAVFSPLLRAGVPYDLVGAQYLIFGWGGRAFYTQTPTWADLKPAPLFAGLTVDDSVIHVDVAGQIDFALPFVTRIQIDDEAMKRLRQFILASFRSGPDGPERIPDAAYGDFDAFFEANGRFNAFAGCNTWTAKALRAAGLRTGWWNPLPQSLAASLALYN